MCWRFDEKFLRPAHHWISISVFITTGQAYKTTTKKTKGQLAEGNDLPKDKISFQPAVLAFGCSFFSL